MPRLQAAKAAELEAFWRAHLASWRASDLNQREYCEAMAAIKAVRELAGEIQTRASRPHSQGALSAQRRA